MSNWSVFLSILSVAGQLAAWAAACWLGLHLTASAFRVCEFCGFATAVLCVALVCQVGVWVYGSAA